MIKIVSWNVNGIRAACKKGFLEWLRVESPDVLCLQEIKAQESQLPAELRELAGYSTYWNPAERLGYSGVATFCRKPPVSFKNGLGLARFDSEGRVLETDFGFFTLFNIYFPNGGMNEDRLCFKLDFYAAVLKHFKKLRQAGKKIVICGDFNIAHKPIDLRNPQANEDVSGFMPIERVWLDKLVETGFIDTFRVFNQQPDQYTWWDMRTRARERNAGWRIDYFFASEDLRPSFADAFIWAKVTGSDHCPLGLILKF